MAFTDKDIVSAAAFGGVSLLPETDSRWCRVLTEAIAFLNALADGVPWYKAWVKPGLKMAAFALEQLRHIKCDD